MTNDFNGKPCPKCGTKMVDTEMILCTFPPVRQVCCVNVNCGFWFEYDALAKLEDVIMFYDKMCEDYKKEVKQ